jgi:FkbM family methyltransferase
MAGTFRKFIKDPLRHAAKLCTDPVYRKYYWLRTKYENIPSGKQLALNFNGLSLIVPDIPSFFSSCREIFIDKIYQFETSSEQPVILDMGANIGLSVIFLKQLYPNARITAYEADKNIFQILSENLDNNGFEDVERHNSAVWKRNCVISFKADNADGGHISDDDSGTSVNAVDFSDILNARDRVDFLKMDIEGAENELFDKIVENLHKIDNFFLEYHAFKNQPQRLGQFLSILEAKNFRYNIENPHYRGMPLGEASQINDFDLQINIWAKNIGKLE